MTAARGIVLVAGGTGLIGKRLCAMLTTEGREVRVLSRKKTSGKYPSAQWNPAKGEMDAGALKDVTQVINLAGAGVADKRWTNNYKHEILQSRLDAAQTLLDHIRNQPGTTEAYIGASASGYYGNRGDELLTEASAPGEGFLAETTRKWEEASENCPIRRVLIRTGIVLTPNGGALPPMARPVKAFFAPVIGGDQYMSWIHIDDLCRMYIRATEDENWTGIFNAVSPESILHKDFIATLKKTLNPQAITMKVPVSFIKLLLGEQSAILLDSANIQPGNALKKGFQFYYDDLQTALRNLYDLR